MNDFKKDYIELFKNILLGTHYKESSWERIYDNHKSLFSWPLSMQFQRYGCSNFSEKINCFVQRKKTQSSNSLRCKGTSGPRFTAVSKKRLDNIEYCINEILENKIEGDFIETGVWRGLYVFLCVNY